MFSFLFFIKASSKIKNLKIRKLDERDLWKACLSIMIVILRKTRLWLYSIKQFWQISFGQKFLSRL